MIRTLGHARLKTGERVRIAALIAPAGRYAKPIRQFVAHKGQPWMLHVDLANQGQTDELRTTYTIGLLGGQIVGNVMIVDDGRVGILGHVFTRPDQRRKGICQHLMAAAMDAFQAAGGRILTLGTGYESPAYWIYHGFGFRSVEPGRGDMVFEAEPGEVARHFAPARGRVADACWQHWPGISLLYLQAAGDRVRSAAYGVFGPAGFEGGFLTLQAQRERVAAQLKVLLAPTGAVAGAAILQRDTRWPAPVHILDVFVHPAFGGEEARLLRSLRLPRPGKVQAYLDHPSASRAAALREAGFRREATLRGQLVAPNRPLDVAIFALRT
ncbi:MAG TPA: GNAT family N-acetyltransferase [Planctomycetota bacterium]|nr:GNAT family N-acetyltransferase [Planctomycetota bacterium]